MATQKKVKRTKKAKKTSLSSEEIEKRNHRQEVRNIFAKAGFEKVSSVSDKEFTFKGRTGDIDDVFLYDNIVVLLEYTCSKTENISSHLLKKKILFDHILNNQADFIQFFEGDFETFKEARNDYFDYLECKVIIVYASKNSVSQQHKDQLPDVVFLDYDIVKYFKSVTNAVKLSSKYELFKFLKLEYNDVGKNSTTTVSGKHNINGSILPESHSNFDPGYKVVSFYIDPYSLLKKSYVLRKDSWRDEGGLYQRMIETKKINAIRRHLHSQKRVFINNIIVTLPSETKLIDKKGNTVDPTKLIKTEPVIIQIPDGFNVIGLIDGQHRVFAYHEGGDFDSEIKKLREKQNLLATGIIYPETINEIERSKFEAKLFLEINSNQATAGSSLKQAIGLILNPFSSESIGRAIVHRLNSGGPLSDKFERPFFDKDKIKMTSIVSYGLRPIVKLSGSNSFFHMWTDKNKGDLLKGDDRVILNKYIDFCTEELNKFFRAIQKTLDKGKWTSSKDVKNKVLTTTAINGFIICLRKAIEENKVGEQDYYEKCFRGLNSFDFSTYKSSQYGAMGRDIFARYFNE